MRRLAEAINAERESEKWAERRSLVGRAVIALSVPLAYLLGRAASPGDASVRALLLLWLFAMSALLVATLACWRAEREAERLLEAAGGRHVTGES